MVGKTDDLCNFATVPGVLIEKVDENTVTFTTRSSSLLGDDSDQNLRKTFTVSRTEVYENPVAGAPAPVAMVPGATGTLFLSRAGWSATSIDGSGFGIYGSGQAVFKYPDCAGVSARFVSKLTVIPTSIVVRGHLEGQTEFFDLELLGPDAEESQGIDWNGADYMELHLTEGGARRLNIASGALTVRAWPTRIVVKGSPNFDPSVSGEVDILDSEMADGVQQFAFANRGAPIVLALTQDGIDAFHVTAQAIAAASSSASGSFGRVQLPVAPVAQPGR
jgi:hypothetical protein